MKRIIIICVSLFCLALVICIVLGISHSSSVFHHNASKLTEEYTGEYDYFYHSRKMLKDVQESPTEFVTPDDLTKIEENDYPQFALPLYNLCSNVGLYETAAITNRSNILSPKYLRLNL